MVYRIDLEDDYVIEWWLSNAATEYYNLIYENFVSAHKAMVF